MARRRNAWLTPDVDITEGMTSRCLVVPSVLLPHVSGALSLLTEVWRWEAFGTMSPEDAAQLMTVMLEGFIGDGCTDMDCNGVIQCLIDAGLLDASLPDGDFQVVDGVPQVSFDEGVTWQDIGASGSSEPYVPTPTPTPGETDEIRKCLAATRAALVLNETYKGVYGAVAAGIYNASNTFANWLLVLNGQLLGLIYGEHYQILNGEILRDYTLPTNYTASELTPSQLDDLTCLLLDYATDNPDGIVTFDWGAIRDNMITEMGVNPGTALWSIVAYLQSRGLERASQVAITGAGDCDHCAESVCDSGNTQVLLLNLDDRTNSGGYSWSGTFSGQPSNACGTLTTLVPGNERVAHMPIEHCVSAVTIVGYRGSGTENPLVSLTVGGNTQGPTGGAVIGGNACNHQFQFVFDPPVSATDLAITLTENGASDALNLNSMFIYVKDAP